jgi:hypothetical protein
MRRLPAAVAAIAAVLCMAALVPIASARSPLPPGKVVTVEYAPPTADEAAAHDLLTRTRVLERAGRTVGRELALGRPLQVRVVGGNAPADDDPAPGPYYDPANRTIHLSYGFVDDVQAALRRLVRREKIRISPAVLTTAATEFILYHEIGHALVHRLDVPVTGREEDAVDQLAALMSVSRGKGGEFVPLAAAMLFAAWDDGTAPGAAEYADEHSLKQQRVYSFVCLVYGSNPPRFADLVGEDGLPARRAERCPAEWYQSYRSWTRLLRPYARVKAPIPPPIDRLGKGALPRR